MWIELLRVAGVRCVAQAELDLSPGLNLLLGANGAGKTSLLEAGYLISHGHSFRAGSRETLIGRGAEALTVFARVRHDDRGLVQRLGLERRAGTWTGRLDDRPLDRLTDLFRACAVCCFEPGSHELVAGPSEERRAFLDWGVFHVEPEFLGQWRRYQGALKQRNALLKQDAADAELDAWDIELERWGTQITTHRAAYAARFSACFADYAARLLPGLDEAAIRFLPGWEADNGVALAAQLRVVRDRDRQRQTTTLGPHRADWRPRYAGFGSPQELSRGQAKLTALAAVLAQARAYRDHAGEWPVLLVDDLPSELDPAHQRLLLAELTASGAQALITATDLGPALADVTARARLFHVEHGRLRPADPAAGGN
jgi:DNA replication and repair protein RecF